MQSIQNSIIPKWCALQHRLIIYIIFNGNNFTINGNLFFISAKISRAKQLINYLMCTFVEYGYSKIEINRTALENLDCDLYKYLNEVSTKKYKYLVNTYNNQTNSR